MPKRFQFRLEGLLRLRKSLEEEARRQLAARIQERDEIQAALDRLRADAQAALEARRAEPGTRLDLDHWKAIERFLVVLEQRIAQQHLALEAAELRVQEARSSLTHAHQEHLMLVRLKEKRKAQHDLEAEREEAALQDEISVLRHRFRFHLNPLQQVLP